MTIHQTADALNRFLAQHGMDPKGVRVIIEFDDINKAHKAYHYMKDEFSVQMDWKNPNKPPESILPTKILSIPFSFVAKIT